MIVSLFLPFDRISIDKCLHINVIVCSFDYLQFPFSDLLDLQSGDGTIPADWRGSGKLEGSDGIPG